MRCHPGHNDPANPSRLQIWNHNSVTGVLGLFNLQASAAARLLTTAAAQGPQSQLTLHPYCLPHLSCTLHACTLRIRDEYKAVLNSRLAHSRHTLLTHALYSEMPSCTLHKAHLPCTCTSGLSSIWDGLACWPNVHAEVPRLAVSMMPQTIRMPLSPDVKPTNLRSRLLGVCVMLACMHCIAQGRLHSISDVATEAKVDRAETPGRHSLPLRCLHRFSLHFICTLPQCGISDA